MLLENILKAAPHLIKKRPRLNRTLAREFSVKNREFSDFRCLMTPLN